MYNITHNLMRYSFYNLLIYIGINMGLVGFVWIIIDSGGTAKDLAFYTLITVLTSIIVSMFLGAIIDKYNNFLIIKITILIQGLIHIYYVFFGDSDEDLLIKLFILAVINSACLSIYNAASRGAINYIVDKKDLLLGNSLLEVCIQGGTIFASLLTGIMYNYYGEDAIFLIMGISFVVGALLIKIIPIEKREDNVTYLKKLKSGFIYTFSRKDIMLLGITMVLPVVVTLLSNTVLPLYVKKELQSNSVVFGIADMIFGLGAVVLGLIMNTAFKKIRYFYIYMLSIACLLSLVFFKSVLFLFVVYFIFGVSNTFLKIDLNTRMMQRVEHTIYGQVNLLFNIIQNILQIITTFLIASIIQMSLPSIGYLIMAIITLISLILMKFTSIKSN